MSDQMNRGPQQPQNDGNAGQNQQPPQYSNGQPSSGQAPSQQPGYYPGPAGAHPQGQPQPGYYQGQPQQGQPHPGYYQGQPGQGQPGYYQQSPYPAPRQPMMIGQIFKSLFSAKPLEMFRVPVDTVTLIILACATAILTPFFFTSGVFSLLLGSFTGSLGGVIGSQMPSEIYFAFVGKACLLLILLLVIRLGGILLIQKITKTENQNLLEGVNTYLLSMVLPLLLYALAWLTGFITPVLSGAFFMTGILSKELMLYLGFQKRLGRSQAGIKPFWLFVTMFFILCLTLEFTISSMIMSQATSTFGGGFGGGFGF